MSRRAVLVLSVVAAGIALALFFGRSAREGRSLPAAAEPAAAEPALAPVAVPGEPNVPSRAELPREAEPPTPPADPLGPLLVRVVRDSDGAPLAGAELFQLDEPRAVPLALERARGAETNDLATLARRFGQVQRTDARGEAHLSWPDPRTRVGAASDGLWGELLIEHGTDRERELRLAAARPLEVRVVDERGAPAADVPVVVRARAGDAPYVERAWQRTDAAGRTRFAQRGGSLEGRLVRPPGVAKTSVHVSLTAGGHHSGRLVWLDDERFRFVGLSGGSYAFSVGYSHDQGAPHVIAGLAVAPPEPCRDPRLDPLDLARVSHVHRFEVVDERGASIPGARVDLPDASSPRWEEVPRGPGRLEIVSFRDALPRVRVRAPGRRPVELTDVAGETRVELAPGLRVRLVASEPLSGTKDGRRFVASLVHEKFESEGLFDERGEAQLVVSAPGRHEVVIALCQLLDGKPWRKSRIGSFEDPLEVRETPNEQVFTLPPLTEAMLERMRLVTGER